MKCIILAAGYGTRLYPLTKKEAKPLLPVRGKPIIEYISDKLQLTPAVNDVSIVTNNYFYEQFAAWLDNYPHTLPMHIINDGSRNSRDCLGAVKDLAVAIDSRHIDDDTLVIGGDNLFDFNLSDFIKCSLNISPDPSIGIYNLNGRYKARKYGVVKLNTDGRVIDFYEKPPHSAGPHLVSLCLYYLPKETLPSLGVYMKTGNDKDSIGSYIKWLAKNSRMYGFIFKGNWLDIGDIDSYIEAVCSF